MPKVEIIPPDRRRGQTITVVTRNESRALEALLGIMVLSVIAVIAWFLLWILWSVVSTVVTIVLCALLFEVTFIDKKRDFNSEELAMDNDLRASYHRTFRLKNQPTPELTEHGYEELRHQVTIGLGVAVSFVLISAFVLIHYATDTHYQFFPMNLLGLAAAVAILVLLYRMMRGFILTAANQIGKPKNPSQTRWLIGKVSSGTILAYFLAVFAAQFGVFGHI